MVVRIVVGERSVLVEEIVGSGQIGEPIVVQRLVVVVMVVGVKVGSVAHVAGEAVVGGSRRRRVRRRVHGVEVRVGDGDGRGRCRIRARDVVDGGRGGGRMGDGHRLVVAVDLPLGAARRQEVAQLRFVAAIDALRRR